MVAPLQYVQVVVEVGGQWTDTWLLNQVFALNDRFGFHDGHIHNSAPLLPVVVPNRFSNDTEGRRAEA